MGFKRGENYRQQVVDDAKSSSVQSGSSSFSAQSTSLAERKVPPYLRYVGPTFFPITYVRYAYVICRTLPSLYDELNINYVLVSLLSYSHSSRKSALNHRSLILENNDYGKGLGLHSSSSS